jgi:RNA polymerase sigma-70 factor, ECF subfamily
MAFLGELEDFGAFYERTYSMAYRTAWAILRDSTQAEDAVQDAYVAAFRDRAKFRGDAPARSWLLRVVVNAALAPRRRQGPRLVAIQGVEDVLPSSGDDIARSADHLAINSAMGALDPRSRAAIVLRYYLDMAYADIGKAIGTNTNNVGVILHRALARLEQELGRPESVNVGLGEVQHG